MVSDNNPSLFIVMHNMHPAWYNVCSLRVCCLYYRTDMMLTASSFQPSRLLQPGLLCVLLGWEGRWVSTWSPMLHEPFSSLQRSSLFFFFFLKSYRTSSLSGTTRPSVKTSWTLNAQNLLCRYLVQQSYGVEYRMLVDTYCLSDILVAPEDVKAIRTVASIWEHLNLEVSFRTRNISPLLPFQMIDKSTGLTEAILIPSDGLRRKK